MNKSKVAVCSRSFSKNKILRKELELKYDFIKFNDEGLKLEGENLISFLKDQEKAIIALEKIDESILSFLPDLKVISKYGVGTDMLKMEALKKFNIKLGHKKGINKRSVAELTIAFMLNLLRKLPQSNRKIISGGWEQYKGENLTNKTVGIIGCGNVGKELIKLLVPFNCKINVFDIKTYKEFYERYSVNDVSLKFLLQTSDIVSIHIPLNDLSKNLIDQKKINLLKSSSILINTSRGGIVDENALKVSLKSNTISGAAFDVFFQEPPLDQELINLPNFFATPHIGGSSQEAILSMGRQAIIGLEINSYV